jgi:hypothetical protein
MQLYSWLADNLPDAALPAVIRIARNALQALVPGAEDPAIAQKCAIATYCMDLVWNSLTLSITQDILGARHPFLATCAKAGASLPPPPQWQADTLDLAIRILELMGALRCMDVALPAARMLGDGNVSALEHELHMPAAAG